MIKRLATGVALLSFVLTAAVATAAGTLTEVIQRSRMTVLDVDRASGRFLCVEHRRWTPVVRADLAAVTVGDIVRVERQGDARAALTVVRTAAEELSSPER